MRGRNDAVTFVKISTGLENDDAEKKVKKNNEKNDENVMRGTRGGVDKKKCDDKVLIFKCSYQIKKCMRASE